MHMRPEEKSPMRHPEPSLPGHTVGSVLPRDGESETPVARMMDLPPAVSEWPEQIAMISHELRNSLAVVRHAARILSMPLANGIDGARILIERQVGHMSRHVDDLLALTARENKGYRMQRSYIDLSAAARSAIDGVAPDFARRGHRLAVSLPVRALCIYADSARLEQVFTNLLMNAAKYTPNGGDIGFTIECRDQKVIVCIRDSGIGIAPAMLPRVFDMYVQADERAPDAEGGRGIGLAVVRRLVGMHGGTVKATSAGLGQGSVFTVVLPVFR